uniref:Armadillo repeat-containing domain-containing protein n=1 Tax=Glossina brevipalpis TaxID=37001 RepID=A0A1A9WDH4_9MUSC
MDNFKRTNSCQQKLQHQQKVRRQQQKERREQEKQMVYDLQQYTEIFWNMRTPKQQFYAAHTFCNLLTSTKSPSIKELIASGVISMLVWCSSQTNCPRLKLQLLNVLYTTSTLSEEHRILIRQVGGTQELVTCLLHYKEVAICELTLRTIDSVAKNNSREYDLICGHDGISPLLAMMIQPEIVLRKQALTIVQNLSSGSQYRVNLLFEHNIIAFIKLLLAEMNDDAEVVVQTLILSCHIIQEGNRCQKQKIIEADFLQLLIDVLRNENTHIRRVAADTIYELLIEADPNIEFSRGNIQQILSLLCDYLCTEELWILQIIYDLLIFLKKCTANELIYSFNSSDCIRKIKEITTNSNKLLSVLAVDIVKFCHSN